MCCLPVRRRGWRVEENISGVGGRAASRGRQVAAAQVARSDDLSGHRRFEQTLYQTVRGRRSFRIFIGWRGSITARRLLRKRHLWANIAASVNMRSRCARLAPNNLSGALLAQRCCKRICASRFCAGSSCRFRAITHIAVPRVLRSSHALHLSHRCMRGPLAAALTARAPYRAAC